jgi:hypothetical protein
MSNFFNGFCMFYTARGLPVHAQSFIYSIDFMHRRIR